MSTAPGTVTDTINSSHDESQKKSEAGVYVSPTPSENQTKDAGLVDECSPLSRDELRVLLKLDLQILPLITICYALQFLDKSSLGFASILGIIQDTKLKGSEYSWTNSIFFFGYLIFSYPTSVLIVKFPIGKYISTTVVVWSVILILHAACHNFGGLMAVRFFLGVFEATVTPGFAILIGTFYHRREQPFRQCFFFIGNGIAGIFGGLVAYGIAHMQGKLAAWKYLFIIYGAVTVFWGILMFTLLPDAPEKAHFLNENERKIAANRVRNNGSKKVTSYEIRQIIDALTDPQAWLLVFHVFCINIANGGFAGFGNILIQGFGFDLFSTLLLQIPFAFSQIFFMGVGAFFGTFVKNARLFTMFGLMLVSITGTAMMFLLPEDRRVAKVAGGCLASAFAANLPMTLSMVTSNVVGFTKKATVMAMVFIAYCTGNIAGPQFFLMSEAPKFHTALKTILAAFSCAALFALLDRAYLWNENRKRDKEASENGSVNGDTTSSDANRITGKDLTDREDRTFRYLL